MNCPKGFLNLTKAIKNKPNKFNSFKQTKRQLSTKYFSKSRDKQQLYNISSFSLILVLTGLSCFQPTQWQQAHTFFPVSMETLLFTTSEIPCHHSNFLLFLISLSPCETEITFSPLWGSSLLFLFIIIQAQKELPVDVDKTDTQCLLCLSFLSKMVCLNHLTAFYEG